MERDRDLKALRIDREKRGPGSTGGGRSWMWVLAAFFVGSLLTLALFRTFLAPDRPETAVQAGADAPANPAAAAAAPSVESGPAPLLIVSGYIVPHHRIEVGSKVLGKVSWVGVEKSDLVEKGQLLVKLDDSEYRAQYEQARAALASSEARLAELEAGSRPEEIERAQAEWERAKAEFVNADLEFKRQESLLKTGVVAQSAIDNAKARRDIASAVVEVAAKNYELAQLGPRKEQIQSARAEVERNRASIRFWDTQIKETEIRAPSAGTVLERIADVGEMVSTAFAGGAVVVALADLSDLQVELDISQSDFHNIARDIGCRVAPVAYPERKYDCQIAEIAPEANRARATIQVKVQILNPDEFLRPEMDAQVTFYRPASKSEAGAGAGSE